MRNYRLTGKGGGEKKTERLRGRAGDHRGAKLADTLVLVLLVPPDVSKAMICEALHEFRKESKEEGPATLPIRALMSSIILRQEG